MATDISEIECTQCGYGAISTISSYSEGISCFNCGFTFAEKFLGTEKEFLVEDWYRKLISEGHVPVEAINGNGDPITFLRRTKAGHGTVHYAESNGSSVHILAEPLSQERELEVLEDATVIFMSKWDAENKRLVIIKGAIWKWMM